MEYGEHDEWEDIGSQAEKEEGAGDMDDWVNVSLDPHKTILEPSGRWVVI